MKKMMCLLSFVLVAALLLAPMAAMVAQAGGSGERWRGCGRCRRERRSRRERRCRCERRSRRERRSCGWWRLRWRVGRRRGGCGRVGWCRRRWRGRRSGSRTERRGRRYRRLGRECRDGWRRGCVEQWQLAEHQRQPKREPRGRQQHDDLTEARADRPLRGRRSLRQRPLHYEVARRGSRKNAPARTGAFLSSGEAPQR